MVFALLPFSKISFAFTDPAGLSYLFAAYAAASFYCWKRNMLRLAPALEAVSIGVLMTIPLLIASYMAASVALPLMDQTLERADQALGFKWNAFIEFIDAYPLGVTVLAKAYSSFAIQLLALPLILGAVGRYERVYVMMLSYSLMGYIGCIVSIWFPAVGTYAFHGLALDQLTSINAHYGYAFLADFNAVRDQQAFAMSVANAAGIITFPSLHAAGALLCAWAAWDIKIIRYPFAIWNIIMAASAISHGSHYLIDVIAGVVLGAISIFLVKELLSFMQRKEWRTPSPSTVLAMLVGTKSQEPESRSPA